MLKALLIFVSIIQVVSVPVVDATPVYLSNCLILFLQSQNIAFYTMSVLEPQKLQDADDSVAEIVFLYRFAAFHCPFMHKPML